MKISEMIDRLTQLKLEHGDLDVMGIDYNSDAVWEVGRLKMVEVEEGDYPEDWNMPEGFKFIQVGE